ncbi:MAG: class II aldolase/adducin family protein [Bacteroidales bacterium]
MPPIPKKYYPEAESVCYYADLLWQRSFVEGNGGNITVKISDFLIMATPTLFSKKGLRVEDMTIIDKNGVQLYGENKVTSEISSHLSVYKSNPSAKSVIHTHPPYTCSYAFTEHFPTKLLSPEAIFWIDDIVFAPYSLPGSAELAAQIESLSKGKSVLILQNHGLLTWGGSIKDAYWRTEIVENHCRVSHLIDSTMATPRHFSYKQLTQLHELKKRFFK